MKNWIILLQNVSRIGTTSSRVTLFLLYCRNILLFRICAFLSSMLCATSLMLLAAIFYQKHNRKLINTKSIHRFTLIFLFFFIFPFYTL